uniref:Uncharacterized protein n=1 Tax=Magallana gigas TaxID=29159 RepID=A0A8W8HVC5_MAGGI
MVRRFSGNLIESKNFQPRRESDIEEVKWAKCSCLIHKLLIVSMQSMELINVSMVMYFPSILGLKLRHLTRHVIRNIVLHADMNKTQLASTRVDYIRSLKSVQSNGRASVPPSPQHEDSKPLAGNKSSVPAFTEEVTKQQLTKKPTHPLVKAEPSNGQPNPSLLVPTPLKDLKNQKGFFKVICKRDKELESLSKKHEKVPKEYRAIYEEKCRKLTEQFRDVGLCDSREELNGEQNTPL